MRAKGPSASNAQPFLAHTVPMEIHAVREGLRNGLQGQMSPAFIVIRVIF